MSDRQRGMLWTTGLYLVGMSWLPAVGPFLAGLVGGFFARTRENALLAGLPSIAISYVVLIVVHLISPLPTTRWLAVTGMNTLVVIGALVGLWAAPSVRRMLGGK